MAMNFFMRSSSSALFDPVDARMTFRDDLTVRRLTNPKFDTCHVGSGGSIRATHPRFQGSASLDCFGGSLESCKESHGCSRRALLRAIDEKDEHVARARLCRAARPQT